MRVSSPHRYCRNEDMKREVTEWALFQALIGTVETPAQATIGESVTPLFQALIGTVETRGTCRAPSP